MSLIDNLKKINTYKEEIRSALFNKGLKDIDGAKFIEFANKIKLWQIESGDTPSTPTPSADYIYSNGYLLGSDPITIVDNIPHKIDFNDNDKFVIDIICPKEIKGSSSKNIYDIILTIDVPIKYTIGLEYYDQGTIQYYPIEVVSNPRHSVISRNGVEYNSYVRKTTDGKYQNSSDISSDALQYRITINKN